MADGAAEVYERAVRLLEARARSVAELRRSLLRRRPGKEPPDPSHVDAALARLEAAGYLNDASYAEQLARSKALNAGHSRRRIRQELGRRGVSADLSDDAIETVFEEEAVDEEALVERAALKKLRTMGGLDGETRRRRLYGYLARRGYELDDVTRVVARLLGAHGGSGAPGSAYGDAHGGALDDGETEDDGLED